MSGLPAATPACHASNWGEQPPVEHQGDNSPVSVEEAGSPGNTQNRRISRRSPTDRSQMTATGNRRNRRITKPVLPNTANRPRLA